MFGSYFCGLWNKKGNANGQNSGAKPEEKPIPVPETDDDGRGEVKTEETAIPIQATDDDSREKGVPKYSFEELAKATGDFSNNNRVGQGGSGQVYKGTLPNGKQVAVKRLKHHSDPEIEQMAQLHFEDEVKTIGRIRHRNIVEIVGYCSEKADRLLVYEFVSNNSLKSHLYVGRRQQETVSVPIDWPTRMKIALDTAKGLAYLHEDCTPRIIHRNIKSENILIDDKFNPKIGDFGISKDFTDSATPVSTDPRGTPYVPPEYYNKDGQNRKLTDKSDVFSFGLVLLELITGKLAVFEKQRKEYIRLAIWAMPLVKQILDADNQDLDSENCKDLFDSKLQNNYEKDDMIRMIYCVVACVYKPVKLRPQMSQIVEVLKGNMEPKTIWVRSDCKYLYEGSPYAPLPQAHGTSSDSCALSNT
ncbi:proline-rich receptor-like protein kinase PERK1 isoform X2 [Manihot esculenta]|uniref:non-specific serine/threonine protein kinase n=1 Tax=Manihot esculenta TaxID=3983 RepID=A0A2C9UZI6_MANES|nr:proline-rich receptor-like protein kinase PERK1 isoform X2 [Manihot esculenta]